MIACRAPAPALATGLRLLLLATLTAGSSVLVPAAEPPPAKATIANPIIAGDWSDPALIRVGEDYYSCRSSFGWQPGIPIVHSRDLRHWRYVGHAFTTHPKLQPGDTRAGFWGVEMGFNPNTAEFLIYAPTRDHEVYVFHSQKPDGPYAMQSLGAGLGIDPGFFADDDGRLFLITNRATLYELERDGLALRRTVATIDRSRHAYFEGADLFKHNGWYYLLFSDGGTLPHEPSTISTLRARRLEGPWEEDPGNPVMFATDGGTQFEGPAHGTLIDTPKGEWFLAYHAHEPAFYTLGRQMLLQPVEWTTDGWWRPVGGKVPAPVIRAPALPQCDFVLADSDEFASPELGLQWFFTCPPDFSGRSWSLTECPGHLRLRTSPGGLNSLEALPAIFQQRVRHKRFSVETRVTFAAHDGQEAAGLHFFHDPRMNFWLASTVRNGRPVVAVGRTSSGRCDELWVVPNPHGPTVHLRIAVDGEEAATFFFGADGRQWQPVGEKIYFGASAHHLRDGRRGDPDLGWVGVYKTRTATGEVERSGNVWTAATFGLFAVRAGAPTTRNADFEFIHVSQP